MELYAGRYELDGGATGPVGGWMLWDKKFLFFAIIANND